MNIFPTHRDPFKAAEALDDKRIVRQASEVVIMLGGVMPLMGMASPYAVTRQPGHKLNKWLLAETDNFRWTMEYAYACNVLYRQIYGRANACTEPLLAIRRTFIQEASRASWPVSPGGMIAPPKPATFCNAASNKKLGLDFTSAPDTIKAYRAYLVARWGLDRRAPTWTGRQPPLWRK